MSSPPTFDTIIIGAGMSGLAAGIRLAQFDQRVLILEKHYLWGGLNSFFKRAGRRFDVGLHALTNWVPKGTRGTPLSKLLRQLRLGYDDLKLGQQSFSEVRFPGVKLAFSNDFELLRSEIARAFPDQVEGFESLVRRIDAYDAFRPSDTSLSARSQLSQSISDPQLVDMLLCPLLFYGSAREDDVDWYQGVILFKSILQEGFARPAGGIKPLLDLLVARYRDLGGELRMRSGVKEIVHEDGRCLGVRLEDGQELAAQKVLSSAGWAESMRLAGDDMYARHVRPEELGTLSFVESIHALDREPAELGFDATIQFFNDAPEFRYRRPAGLVDTQSGVLCCPNNYASEEPLREGIIRTTSLANPVAWRELVGDAYEAAKEEVQTSILARAQEHLGFHPRDYSVFSDCFTPRTVERFTGRIDGAVYGASTKRFDGKTPLQNLHLIGTDQGLLGVTGAMLSGVSMANRYCLKPSLR
jgi:phytoene dehydrogenase-like protein